MKLFTKNNRKEMKIMEERLSEYLECESLLRYIFDKSDFCAKNCEYIGKELDIGCCVCGYYNNFQYLPNSSLSLLKEKRNKKYGKPPKEKLGGCFYHTPSGCSLKEYKSAVCISHICTALDDYLKTKYKIDLKDKLIQNTLEGILGDWTSGKNLLKFKEKLREFCQKADSKQVG